MVKNVGRGCKWSAENLRFMRINAPKMTGPEKAKGEASRDFLRERINANDLLVTAGHAVYQNY